MLTEAVAAAHRKCACQQEGAVVAAGEAVTAAKDDVHCRHLRSSFSILLIIGVIRVSTHAALYQHNIG